MMTQEISQFVFSVLAVSFLLPLHLLFADELPPSKEPPVTLSLAPEYVSVKPDSDFHIAAKVTMADGWHVYWKEPGRFGLPTVFLATINGASVEMDERWPAPAVKKHPDGGLSYEYQRSFAVVLGPFRSAKDSQKEIRAEVVARWLACSDQLCIPKKVPATVSIPVSATSAVSKSSEYLKLEESLPELTSVSYEVKQAPLGDVPLILRLHPKGEKFGVLADDTVVMAFAGNRLKFLSSSVSDSESLDLEFSIRNPAHPPELKGLVVSGFFVSRTGAASRAFLGESQ